MLPERQDDFLDQGYFRSAHTIRQTRFVFIEQQLYSTIWSRVPLQTYTLSKRQRKLFRRTLTRFHVSVQPYRASDEQDDLYHVYQAEHPLDVAATLRDVLGHHPPTHRFQTYSLHVREAGRLVAFSCFDVDEDSIASIFGCYHPDVANHSLGSFSLLGEMAYGRELGLTHYHPGYCVPGVPAFAYKMRLPDLEGKTYVIGDWKPMGEVLEEPLPHLLLEQAMQAASKALIGQGVPHRTVQMPLCEMMEEIAQGYGPMPLPLMIELTDTNPLGETFIGFDILGENYEVWYGQPVGNLRFEPDFEGLVQEVHPDANLKFYEWRTVVFRTQDVSELLEQATGSKLLKNILAHLPFWALKSSKE